MRAHRVVVLALDRVVPFDLGIPARVFGAATDADGRPLYEVLTCSIDGRRVTTNAGFAIVVDYDHRALMDADTVVIATQEPMGRLRTEGVLAPTVEAALAQVPSSTRLVSICTGSFVLAAAGLLDGRPATTHWIEAPLFQKLFPRVRVDPDVLFVDDGRVLTSAGAAAGLDLCLHIVRRDHGSEVANTTARRCVVPPWREGGQAQFIERPLPRVTTATTVPTREWALEHLERPLRLPGFGSATSLRQHLQDAVGVAPLTYRLVGDGLDG